MATSQQYGAYIPTSYNFDIQQLQQTQVTDPLFKELLVRLYQNVNNIALVLNVKDTGMYQLSEFVTSQQLFPNPNNNSSTTGVAIDRPILRQTYNVGALGAGATTIIHNIFISTLTQFIKIYGVANDNIGNNYYPLPWASAAGATNIELKINATQIVITNNSGINFTSCIVILEYIQS